MTLEQFKELLDLYRKTIQTYSDLSNIGFDFFDNDKYPLINYTESLFDKLLEITVSKEGIDWIYWFIYENKLEATSEDKLICYDIESLHSYLTENKYFKI